MKNLIYIVLVLTVFLCSAQSLEIHQIGRGDGDSALIIAIDTNQMGVYDTAVVLIDAQRSRGAALSVAEYLRDTLTNKFPNRRVIDFVVTSHIHQDHLGGMIPIMEIFIANGWRVGNVVDRFALNLVNLDYVGQDVFECYDSVNHQAVRTSAQQYKQYVDQLGNRITVQPSNNLFHFKGFQNISFTCLAASGVTLNNNQRHVFLDQLADNRYRVRSENDLSYAWLLAFQGFHYFTGGDIGGGGGGYANGETPIAAYMNTFFQGHNFHVCAMKVSHHGSAHSTNDLFLQTTNPTLSVVIGNLRTFGGTALPTFGTLHRLSQNPTELRYAFTVTPANPTVADYSNRARFLGYNDVVIKIPQAPGFPGQGQGLQMQVFQRNRNNDQNYSPVNANPTHEVITCNKNHQ